MIIILLLLIISGVSKSICDVSASNYYYSKLPQNPYYWCKSMSYRNKWKNGDIKQGEAFLGSSTFLVLLTDAWHLFDVIRDITLIAACLLVGDIIWLLLKYHNCFEVRNKISLFLKVAFYLRF